MALPATDNFNRANGGLGSNWTIQLEVPAISSNQVVGQTSNGQHHQFWNADTFNDDQYAQVVFRSAFPGPAVRAAGTGAATDNYFTTSDGPGASIYKQVDGAFTQLTTGTGTSNGDVLYLEVSGTSLVAKKNGAAWMSTTDSTHASGSAGCQLFHTTGALDDWEGGNLATASTFAGYLGCGWW